MFIECDIAISIHAVLWDRDGAIVFKYGNSYDFNPRGPLGPRRDGPVSYTHLDVYKRQVLYSISIHAVLWDRDVAMFHQF